MDRFSNVCPTCSGRLVVDIVFMARIQA